jgi:hypothetical protein
MTVFKFLAWLAERPHPQLNLEYVRLSAALNK